MSATFHRVATDEHAFNAPENGVEFEAKIVKVAPGMYYTTVRTFGLLLTQERHTTLRGAKASVESTFHAVNV